ncbi:hypothetical protein [Sorangium sp. So ce176]
MAATVGAIRMVPAADASSRPTSAEWDGAMRQGHLVSILGLEDDENPQE